MKKEPPWKEFDNKESSGFNINPFVIYHYLVLLALWVCLGFFAFNEEYSHVITIAVIIIAWKMKSRVES